jgi:acetyl-CoA C-acetyltransferase
MTRVPIGSNMKGGSPLPPTYASHYEFASQFQGAELIAKEWGITREDTDRFGFRSMTLATKAWAAGHFDREVFAVDAPALDESGTPTGAQRRVARDEGLRETSLEKLSTLKATLSDGVHTAGSSSQISDGAACVLLGTPERARALGIKPRARIVATTLVGVDPYTMLKGPIPATQKLLKQTGIPIHGIDVFEINEAFASVVLAWQKELGPNPERVNPNGGAIAIGHPLGCSGARLLTSALHELERIGGRYALIAMCCGGGLGTGTIIERL